jgi:Arc/MetJ-type ribon-helix-helix transcriptional regulator
MKRITISLPDELEAAIQREARRRRVPVSHVVRERLEAARTTTEDARGRRITFAGIGRSGQRDTARRAEQILEMEWASGADARDR